MAGNLGKEDPSSVQDFQDPSITGSGHKRPRGSVQPSSSRAGKKTKREIDRDYRERKKDELKKVKAEMENLKESKIHLEGQASILKEQVSTLDKNLKETSEECTKQKIELQRQSDSIHELEKELIALREDREKEIRALKEEHTQKMLERDREWNAFIREELERQKQFYSSGHMVYEHTANAGEMNNPMETPATAEANSNSNSNFNFNCDPFASQMASLGETYVAGVNI
ncbi:hypothetical protein H0E87_030301 [Populus deltoides]|uniref:Uncharacterized protein n=1 Tax=Populus deltoides TaxID=3696 RepID=A0A8T2WFY6_POPDE|nr:hypothetical protein H0E87_030301 [Populus deltoides]